MIDESWHPISQMPPIFTELILYDDSDPSCPVWSMGEIIGTLDDGTHLFFDGDDSFTVTHWRYLPQPPKSKAKNG
jgi:hypothetical protein